MNDEQNLATELMHEVKLSAKRWFIAFIVTLILWFATIFGFLWYITLPTEDVSIENEDGNANYIGRDLNGGLNNGENNSEEASSESEK